MAAEIENFIMGKDQKPIDKMQKNELKNECQLWRKLFDWLDDKVKFYLSQIGSEVRLMTRFNTEYLGDFLGAKFDPVEFELGVFEKKYDRNVGKYFYERKVIKMPVSSINQQEFIEPEGRQPAEEVDEKLEITEIDQ